MKMNKVGVKDINMGNSKKIMLNKIVTKCQTFYDAIYVKFKFK